MESALDRLVDGELCYVIVGPRQYEAIWSVEHRYWFGIHRAGPAVIRPFEVDEWMTAWTKA